MQNRTEHIGIQMGPAESKQTTPSKNLHFRRILNLACWITQRLGKVLKRFWINPNFRLTCSDKAWTASTTVVERAQYTSSQETSDLTKMHLFSRDLNHAKLHKSVNVLESKQLNTVAPAQSKAACFRIAYIAMRPSTPAAALMSETCFGYKRSTLGLSCKRTGLCGIHTLCRFLVSKSRIAHSSKTTPIPKTISVPQRKKDSN